MDQQQEFGSFVMKTGGIPAGAYNVRFVGFEPYNEHASEYGQGILLKWQVLDGEQAGNETSRICSCKLSAKSALGKLAAAFKGGAIESGERFNFSDYIGCQGTAFVEATEAGGTRVVTFVRSAPAAVRQQPVQLAATQQVPPQPMPQQQTEHPALAERF